MIDLCKKASKLNRSAKYRSGNVIYLPPTGKVVVAGDLHGHRRNFERITALADLPNNPHTYVILQEILHGGPQDDCGGCLSFELLCDALDYQLRFPNNVYIIMGNHDTAIVSDNNVLKAGKEMAQPLKASMKRCFGNDYELVTAAMKEYLLSQPLAVKSPNRIWMSHSLPSDPALKDFDIRILNKHLQPDDLAHQNSVYLLTWGRRHSEKTLSTLAKMFDTDLFILGHQPQPTGWVRVAHNTIIIASDHNHGAVISFDLEKSYTIDELTHCILPLAAIK